MREACEVLIESQAWILVLNPQNPHKGRRREKTHQRCLLTSTHMLWHEHPAPTSQFTHTHSYTFVKENV